MPIRHVACFRFRPGTTSDQVEAMTEGLLTLPSVIPQIAEYRIGPDLKLNDDSWDFCVIADFTDTADYRAYQANPEHQRLIATLVKPILAERASVQYWT